MLAFLLSLFVRTQDCATDRPRSRLWQQQLTTCTYTSPRGLTDRSVSPFIKTLASKLEVPSRTALAQQPAALISQLCVCVDLQGYRQGGASLLRTLRWRCQFPSPKVAACLPFQKRASSRVASLSDRSGRRTWRSSWPAPASFRPINFQPGQPAPAPAPRLIFDKFPNLYKLVVYVNKEGA